jgi:DNA modification methylase
MELAYETKLGKLYLGNANESRGVVSDIDLVFTDPPYPRKFMSCYVILSWLYPDLMKVGASLITIVGHYALEDVIGIFESDGKLKFRWIFDLDQEADQHARMAMGIEVMWKPMLWYVKEKFPRERNYGFMKDKITIPKRDKSLHKWQQSIVWCYDIIQKITKENELVCDPFVGSGTVPLACEMLNRRWVGIDIDEKAINTTIERLKDYENPRPLY